MIQRAAATAGRTGPAAANSPTVLARTQVGGGSTGSRLPLRGRGHAAARGPALRAVGRPVRGVTRPASADHGPFMNNAARQARPSAAGRRARDADLVVPVEERPTLEHEAAILAFEARRGDARLWKGLISK